MNAQSRDLVPNIEGLVHQVIDVVRAIFWVDVKLKFFGIPAFDGTGTANQSEAEGGCCVSE